MRKLRLDYYFYFICRKFSTIDNRKLQYFFHIYPRDLRTDQTSDDRSRQTPRRGTPSENWKLDECLVIRRGCTASTPIYSVDSAGARFQSGLDRRGSGGNSTDPTNPLTLLNRNSEKQTVEWE